MKKIYSIMMFVAVAAMALVSCQKQEIEVSESVNISGLTFTSEKPAFDDETKTEWTGSTIQWSKNDAIRIGYTCDGVWQNRDGSATANEANGSKTAKLYASSNLTEAAAAAKFSVPGNFEGTAEGTYEFYGVYPSGACVNGTDFFYAPSVTVKIPAEQTPAKDSFDSAADIMVAKSPSTYTGIPTDPISLEWTRLVAHGYFTLKELALTEGETLSSIKLTANAEADMVGNHYVYLDTYNVTKPNSNSAANVLTINAANLTADAEGNVTFWASFLPCTWTSVTVVVETDKATYTREIDLSNDQKTFAKNARNRLAVVMSTATREEKVVEESDYSGTYAIVAEKSETEYYYLTNVDNGASTKRLNSSDAISTLPSSGVKLDASLVWNVIKNADGSYYIQSAENNYYLNHTGGNSSVLVENIEDALALTIEHNEGKYLISYLNGTETRNFVRNSSNPYFAFYTSEQCGPVYFIPAVATIVPSIAVEENAISVEADATSTKFNYTVKNITETPTASVKEGATMTNVEVTVENRTVNVTFEANTEESPKTATIVLSYEGAESVEVTITQAAKPAEGLEIASVSIDFSAQGYTNQQEISTAEVNPIDIKFNKGTNSNAPKYFTNGTAIRVYAGGYFTVSSEKTIVKVELTFGTSDGSNTITTDTGTYSDGVWTGSSKSVKFTVGGTSGNRRIKKMTISYLNDGESGGETPGEGGEDTPQTYSYTFTSKAWADDTESWTSGKDGNEMTSDRGVQVTTGTSGANATCKTNMSNVKQVVVVYSTNASKGAGKISIAVGAETKELSVTKEGGTSDRELVFDFSSSLPSGTPKITVTCTTNSIYVKSVEFTTN